MLTAAAPFSPVCHDCDIRRYFRDWLQLFSKEKNGCFCTLTGAEASEILGSLWDDICGGSSADVRSLNEGVSRAEDVN